MGVHRQESHCAFALCVWLSYTVSINQTVWPGKGRASRLSEPTSIHPLSQPCGLLPPRKGDTK